MPQNNVMDELKKVFEGKPLTYEDFEKGVTLNNIKLADLGSGEYMDMNKHKEALDLIEKRATDQETSNKELLKNIDKLQKDNLPKAELDKAIADLKETHETEIKKQLEAHASFIKTSKINDAIRSIGGNPDLLVPYMTSNGLMDKISIDGENIIGLNDVLGSLKTNPATMSLFPLVEPKNTDPHASNTDGKGIPEKKEFKTIQEIMDNLDEAETAIVAKENATK